MKAKLKIPKIIYSLSDLLSFGYARVSTACSGAENSLVYYFFYLVCNFPLPLAKHIPSPSPIKGLALRWRNKIKIEGGWAGQVSCFDCNASLNSYPGLAV